MCVFWRARQARLGIDDFGNPLEDADGVTPVPAEDVIDADVHVVVEESPDEDTPLLLKKTPGESQGLFGWVKTWKR